MAGRLWYGRKRNEVPKLAQLIAKGRPEMRPVSDIESAVAQPVIGARKGDHAGPAGCEHCRFEGRFDCFKS